jgi:hypothetical protein
MIPCRYATTLHTDAREGALPTGRRVLYAVHMRLCAACRAYAKGLEQTEQALHDLEREPAPDALKASLVARLRQRR